jgi:hypothetical protein
MPKVRLMDQPNLEIKLIRAVQQILLHSIIPVVCSTAIGFLYYLWNVFNYHFPVFQFIQNAAVASIFYYSLIYLTQRNAFGVLLILFLLVICEMHSTRLMYVLRDLFYTAAVASAVLLYARQLRTNPSLNGQYYGLVFSGILGVCTVVAWSVQYFLVEFVFRYHPPMPFTPFVWMAATFGFMTGLGVGVGIVLNRKISSIFDF